MATFTVGKKILISGAHTNDTYVLGDAVADTFVGTWGLMFLKGTLVSPSLVVQARLRGAEVAADAVDYLPINYLNVYLNGSTGDNTYVSTALTDDSLILIPASGFSISIDLTATSGDGTLYAFPVVGAAA